MYILSKTTKPEVDTVLFEEFNKWEAENGKRLPNSYKLLLGIANGGYVYPNIVANTDIEGRISYGDAGLFFSVLYDWHTCLSNFEGDTFGEGTPPNFLMFGNDPGGVEFILSVRNHDFGSVYGWPHSSNIWGTDGNEENALILISSSFAGFISSLSDNREKDGLDFFGGEEELKRAIVFDVEDLK